MIPKTNAKLLIVGCGDIGVRLAGRLSPEQFAVSGLRRSVDKLPDTIAPIACDLNDHAAIQTALKQEFDYWVVTITPTERSESGYRRAYNDNLKALLKSADTLPKHIFFVSSTSVYGQNNGEWVDETSVTNPNHYRGAVMLAAEKLCFNSGIPTSVIRCSGIYGPGRERTIELVREAKWQLNDKQWTNRIHADDVAAVLAWCIHKVTAGQKIKELYLAGDDEPATKHEAMTWMAKLMGAPLPVEASPSNNLNKRCNNARLKQEGFVFSCPSFREGYRRLLAQDALNQLGVLEKMQGYNPQVVSTIWAGLDIEESDIDIVCEFENRDHFVSEMSRSFGDQTNFSTNKNQQRVLIQFTLGGFLVEVYATTTPVENQVGFRHFQIMKRLANLGGASFQQSIRALKMQGLKTEPAIARLLKLDGDPYAAVLALEQMSDQYLQERLQP